MARTGSEQAAINRANGLLDTEVVGSGGSVTIRVAVAHSDEDHPSSATFHYGPAFNDQMAELIAHVREEAPGDVDLIAEANKTLERAQQEFPESEGWEVWLEAIVPHDDGDRHVVRRIEEE
jgi:L-alanine-DL-glutamate epimerase-like enolase superfamily enzyme